ncbi:MAG: hypothetical protein ACFFE4_01200 [Candidatus Thorarchaeota archaeon]
MRNKVECNSCGHMEIVDYEDVQFCPECGSSDVKFELAPETEPKVTSEIKVEVMAERKSEIDPDSPLRRVYTWTERKSSQRHSGYSSGTGFGMSEGAKIRLVLGIVGFIMVLSAIGMFVTGMSGGFSGGFTGIIVLAVIGFIFLAIATKGEICS